MWYQSIVNLGILYAACCMYRMIRVPFLILFWGRSETHFEAFRVWFLDSGRVGGALGGSRGRSGGRISCKTHFGGDFGAMLGTKLGTQILFLC